jgi:hypothetical protein
VRLTVAAVPVVLWQGYIARVEADPTSRHPAYAYQRAAYLYHNVSYATNIRLREPFLPERGTISVSEGAWRFVRNLRSLPASLGEVVSTDRQSWEGLVGLARRLPLVRRLSPVVAVDGALSLFGTLAIFGIGVLVYRHERLVSLLLVAYVLVVCVTPWPGQWSRYLGPVAPLLVLAAIQGALSLQGRVGRSRTERRRLGGTTAVEIAIALVLGLNLVALVWTHLTHFQRVEYLGRHGEPVAYRLYAYRSTYSTFDTGLDWLRQHAAPSDIVATTMPHWVYLRAGLRAVMPPAGTDPGEILRLLDSVPVTYVMAGGSSAVIWARGDAFPAVRRAPDVWAPIYASPDGELTIYERTRRPSPSSP